MLTTAHHAMQRLTAHLRAVVAIQPEVSCCYVISIWAGLTGLAIDWSCGWRHGALAMYANSLMLAAVPLFTSDHQTVLRRNIVTLLNAVAVMALIVLAGGTVPLLLFWGLLIPLGALAGGSERASVVWTLLCGPLVVFIIAGPTWSGPWTPHPQQLATLTRIALIAGTILMGLLLCQVAGNFAQRRRQIQFLQHEVQLEVAARRDLLAKMSHELRTPMTAIQGYAEELAPRVVDASSQRATEAIQRNSRAMLASLEDLLEWGKLECGALPLQCAPCSTTRLLSSTHVALAELPAPVVPNAALEYEGPVPERIVTDRHLLEKAIVKAAAAALHATGRGGIRLLVRHRSEQRQLEIDVTPLGEKWDLDELQKLFDHSGAPPSVSGGFSLAMSRGLTRLLGGDVEIVQHKRPESAALRITVPCGTLHGVPMVTPQTTGPTDRDTLGQRGRAPRLDDCRILLVEDSPDTKALMTFLLTRAGAEVQAVENGQAAIAAALSALAKRTPFDIILMDMQMPIMDGREATLRLRKQGYDRPIIAFTAQSVEYTREKCIRAGCDDYITKPFRSHTMIELVARYARRNLEAIMKS
jgi:CheY-like chemotaxis protein